VAASDIVKASDEDLAWLYPHRTPEESLAAWLELGPALAALTRGASGPVAPQRSPAPGRGQTRRTQPNSARSLFGCRPRQGINESGRRREGPPSSACVSPVGLGEVPAVIIAGPGDRGDGSVLFVQQHLVIALVVEIEHVAD
jgi:hypothetical protein